MQMTEMMQNPSAQNVWILFGPVGSGKTEWVEENLPGSEEFFGMARRQRILENIKRDPRFLNAFAFTTPYAKTAEQAITRATVAIRPFWKPNMRAHVLEFTKDGDGPWLHATNMQLEYMYRPGWSK